MADKESKPWELQKRETARAFKAWLVYRDMEDPVCKRVAEVTGDNPNTVNGWCHKYHWKERLRAWVNNLAKVNARQQEKEMEAMGRRQVGIAVAMQTLIGRKLNEMGKDETGGHKGIKNYEIALWLQTATRVERLARGLPTDRVAGMGKDARDPEVEAPRTLAQYDLEDLKAMEAIHDRAIKRASGKPAVT